MNSQKRILLPIDFQEQSLVSLDYALYFTGKINAELHLLHVVEESNVIQKILRTDSDTIRINIEIENMLASIAAKLQSEFKIVTAVRNGKPYQVIEKYADEIKPEFIMIGKTDTTGNLTRMAGSNALHVINETKFPVITIRGNLSITHTPGDKNIVVPLDFNKPVKEQITASVEFAKLFNAKILIMTINRDDSPAIKTKILTGLNKTLKYIQDQNILCETFTIDDKKTPIHQVINDFAIEKNAKLVIIMTRDESKIRELVVGSNAKGIIDSCQVPVLSIRPWNIDDESNSVFKVIFDPLNIF